MALCNEIIERNTVSWVCDLEIPAGMDAHVGPHKAAGDAKSERERREWEAAQAAPKLSDLQGPAETTAERYTTGASPHPGVEADTLNGVRVRLRNANICPACFQGDHMRCAHRADLIAVFFHGQESIKSFCQCFQTQTVEHGMTSIEALVAEATEIMPTQDDPPEMLNVPPTAHEMHQERPEPYGGGYAPTKQREGDQPLPQQTDEESVQARIIAKTLALVEDGIIPQEVADIIVVQMERSIEVGTERYGTALQTFNGRDTLQDAADEARDLFVYLSSLHQAQETDRDKIVELVEEAVRAKLAGSNVDLHQVIVIAVDTILGATGGSLESESG